MTRYLDTYRVLTSPLPLCGTAEDIIGDAFLLEDMDREHLFVFATDAVGKITGYKRVATGIRSNVQVTIRDILQAAIVLGAEKFWISHNHPNGTSQMSGPDLNLSMDVSRAAKVCGLSLRGHALYHKPSVKFYHMAELEDQYTSLFLHNVQAKEESKGQSWIYDAEYLKGRILKMSEQYSVTLRFTVKSLPTAYRYIREFKRLYLGPEKG